MWLAKTDIFVDPDKKNHFDLVNDQMTMVSEELNVVNEIIRYGISPVNIGMENEVEIVNRVLENVQCILYLIIIKVMLIWVWICTQE